MGLIKRMRRQRAVWWKQSGTDEFGAPHFDEPVEIRCRWEDKFGESFNPTAEHRTSKAMVYVDRIMSVGDMLKRGPMDSNTPSDPKEDQEAFAIIGFDQLPDLKAKETLLTAYL